MNPQKFWRMVAKDPWLLWVIHVGRQLRCGDLLKEPSLLGTMLSPDHIEEGVAYIAFRPWSRLDLCFRNKTVHTRVETPDTSDHQDAWLDATIYWHEEEKEDVPEMEPFSQVLKLRNDQTLQDALSGLKLGSKIDAVVLTGAMDRHKGKDQDILTQLFDPTFEFAYSESFDIYRPSSTLLVGR